MAERSQQVECIRMLDLGQYLLRFQLLYGGPLRCVTDAVRPMILTPRDDDRKRILGKKKTPPRGGGGPTMLISLRSIYRPSITETLNACSS